MVGGTDGSSAGQTVHPKQSQDDEGCQGCLVGDSRSQLRVVGQPLEGGELAVGQRAEQVDHGEAVRVISKRGGYPVGGRVGYLVGGRLAGVGGVGRHAGQGIDARLRRRAA